MLSKRIYTALRLYIPTAAKYGLIGFNWNNCHQTFRNLSFDENKKFQLNFVAYLIYYIFIILQCLRFMFVSIDYEKFNTCFVYLLVLSLLLEYWIVQVFFTESTINEFNGLFLYLRRINRKTHEIWYKYK